MSARAEALAAFRDLAIAGALVMLSAASGALAALYLEGLI